MICGDLGEDQREWEFQPLEFPEPAPVEQPAPEVPAEPVPV